MKLRLNLASRSIIGLRFVLRLTLSLILALTVGLAFSLNAAAASFTFAEVQKHSATEDCWVVIDSKVYDLSKYLLSHPAKPEALNQYCGEDATAGWATKGFSEKGHTHSKKAKILLKKYEVGRFEEK